MRVIHVAACVLALITRPVTAQTWPIVHSQEITIPAEEAITYLTNSRAAEMPPITLTDLPVQSRELCDRLTKRDRGIYVALLSTLGACLKAPTVQGAYDFPFIAKDWNDASEQLNGVLGLTLADALSKQGFATLTYWQGQTRVFASKRILVDATDLKGLKVRSGPSFASTATVQSTGSFAAPLITAEVYAALQAGAIDAVDLSLETYRSAKIAQVANNVLISNHSFDPIVVTAPTGALGDLPPNQQAFLESAMRRATAYQTKRASEVFTNQVAELQKSGVHIQSLSDQTRATFKTLELTTASFKKAQQVFEGAPEYLKVAASARAAGSPATTHYKVFFATNRLRIGDTFGLTRADAVLYGLAFVPLDYDTQLTRMDVVDRSQVTFRSAPAIEVDWKGIEQKPLSATVSRVKHTVPASAPLVYVHGFNNSFDEALKRAAWLGWNARRPVLVFSWPSKGSVLPDAYRSDQSTADESAEALAKVLREVGGQTDPQPDLDVIVHSMGARVMLAALALLASEASVPSPHFRQIIFVAPDVGADSLKRLWPALSVSFDQNATLYSSNHDKALGISKALMNATDGNRAGLSPPVIKAEKIDSIFIGPNDFSFFGHAYFVNNGIIADDMFEALRFGVGAVDRRGIERSSDGEGYFILRRAKTP